MKISIRWLHVIILFVFLICTQGAFAASTSQINRSVIPQDNLKLTNSVESKISQRRTTSQDAQEPQEEDLTSSLDNSNVKVLVKKIDVQGVTLLSDQEIQKINSDYEGKELTLKEVQAIAENISDLYREKGFITSRAYLPPQDINEGVLTIKVVEGKLGNVQVKGNRYFKTSLLKNKLKIKQEGYFDYSSLQRSVVYINQHPDRVAKTILIPGEKPGTTDMVVEVQDRLPIHVGFSYDNYGSRFLGKNRYALTLENNNLLGFDDKVYAKVQTTDSDYMRFGQLQYVVPVQETLNVGVYGIYSDIELGKEFEDLEAKGKARIFGIFLDKGLIQEAGFEWRINAGFDYKNVRNFQLGGLMSRDKVRLFKVGTDLDITDRLGRTIVAPEFDFGVPEIWGGMDSKDALASRQGSGGTFQKGLLNLYRLQPLPLSTSLLWKNSAQMSNHNLPASEQFQIGGPTSVRGYSPAEFAGDKGLYSSLEWSLPPYFIPESKEVFFTHEKWRDALRFVTFYDIGFVNLKNISVGEKENQTLKAWGYGVRLNVKDNVSMRLEVGYPIGNKSADGNNAHPWFEVITKY